MQKPYTSPLIKQDIQSMLSATLRSDGVTRIVRCSHQIACAYLRQKTRSQGFSSDFFGISIEDLAMDCIADMFYRDDNGHFSILNDYFNKLPIDEIDDQEVFIHFRRFVFAKVNEALFRRYQQSDPSLARIIRNMKSAARSSNHITLIRKRGDLYITVPALEGERSGLPLAPPELLEAYLHENSGHLDDIREALSILCFFIQEFPAYSNEYPLTWFARSLRAIHSRLHSAFDNEASEPEFNTDELITMIRKASAIVRKEKEAMYVESGKIDRDILTKYFLAVQDIMTAQFAVDHGHSHTHFEALKRHIPDMDYIAYRTRHRNIFEYLAKMTRKEMLFLLKPCV